LAGITAKVNQFVLSDQNICKKHFWRQWVETHKSTSISWWITPPVNREDFRKVAARGSPLSEEIYQSNPYNPTQLHLSNSAALVQFRCTCPTQLQLSQLGYHSYQRECHSEPMATSTLIFWVLVGCGL
jgi:hypothetical protein